MDTSLTWGGWGHYLGSIKITIGCFQSEMQIETSKVRIPNAFSSFGDWRSRVYHLLSPFNVSFLDYFLILFSVTHSQTLSEMAKMIPGSFHYQILEQRQSNQRLHCRNSHILYWPASLKDVSICSSCWVYPQNFVTLNDNRRNGSAWQVVNDMETQTASSTSPSTLPSAPVCAGSFSKSPSVESWCLGDAVIGAWCSHRRGMLKIPLTDARVYFLNFLETRLSSCLKNLRIWECSSTPSTFFGFLFCFLPLSKKYNCCFVFSNTTTKHKVKMMRGYNKHSTIDSGRVFANAFETEI